MIAHIIHDDGGRIRSVVIQATEVEGELEIRSDQEGELVTVVDLSEILPESVVDMDADSESSRHHLYLIARDIRSGFRVDAKRRKLERLK
jgi:hypothetical protein